MIRRMLAIENAFEKDIPLSQMHFFTKDTLYAEYLEDMTRITRGKEYSRLSCLNSFHAGVACELDIANSCMYHDAETCTEVLTEYLKVISKYVSLFPNPNKFFDYVVRGVSLCVFNSTLTNCILVTRRALADNCRRRNAFAFIPERYNEALNPVTVFRFLEDHAQLLNLIDVAVDSYVAEYHYRYITSYFPKCKLSCEECTNKKNLESYVRTQYLQEVIPRSRAWSYMMDELLV